MFKRLIFLVCLFLSLLMSMISSPAVAQEITVMTRNLYLGADLGPAIVAETPEEFFSAAGAALGQVAANNFPERAWALAAEIAEKKPHLVGLQEVFNFTLDGSNGIPPFRDHLTDLINALTAQGANYRVAAVVKNMEIQVPLFGRLVGVTDRDAILARSDVTCSVVPVALSGCKPSLDGCNYQVAASVDSPVGEITVERGFVAVDAMVGTRPVRFVNTHLEVKQLNPANPNPLMPAIQGAQAFELLSILSVFPNPNSAPVILVGDINSSPQDQIFVVGPYTIVPPYKQLLNAGYADSWTLRRGSPAGLTCCQATDLLNPNSLLYERIDVVFSSKLPVGKVKVNVVGNDETDKTPSGLWPSDHAGVVTRMKFPQ